MVRENTDPHSTAFTVSVDARDGVTTGISAAERALTANLLASPEATPEMFRRPGHMFPLIARCGGVLKRAGHTEAAVDLARLAGRSPVGAICEIMKDDGSMARFPDLVEFAELHGLKIITIEALIRYRNKKENGGKGRGRELADGIRRFCRPRYVSVLMRAVTRYWPW